MNLFVSGSSKLKGNSYLRTPWGIGLETTTLHRQSHTASLAVLGHRGWELVKEVLGSAVVQPGRLVDKDQGS